MKAKPKKHPRAPTTAPDGTWSDEVRRSFIESRLAEAERGPHPPACCGSWTRRLAGRRVVQMPVPRDAGLKPARTPHWFTRWAQAAPPPRRLQEISFTHVVNPFDPGNNTERARSQTVRWHTHLPARQGVCGGVFWPGTGCAPASFPRTRTSIPTPPPPPLATPRHPRSGDAGFHFARGGSGHRAGNLGGARLCYFRRG